MFETRHPFDLLNENSVDIKALLKLIKITKHQQICGAIRPYENYKYFNYQIGKRSKMNTRKLLMAIGLAFMIYGLIIVGYGILTIHVTRTWFGDWHVDKYLDWLTLDVFMMISFALSFFGFILWRYLKYTEEK